jgi:hypothetical protein
MDRSFRVREAQGGGRSIHDAKVRNYPCELLIRA